MRFAFQTLIFLAVILGACGVAAQILTASIPRDTATCQGVEARVSTFFYSRSFTELLASECWVALDQTRKGDDVLSSWYAAAFLDRINELNAAAAHLDHSPTETGEYLIAHQIGVTDALNDWMRASKSSR